MNINGLILLLLGALTLTVPPSFAAGQAEEITVLHCKDLRQYIYKRDGQMEKRDKAYRMEIGITFKPEPEVLFLHWGYFPHTDSDWGQSSNSYKRNEQYFPKYFVVSKADNDTIEIQKVEKSLTHEGAIWARVFNVNRKNGQFTYSDTIRDKDGNFIKYGGVEGIANIEGFCEAEKRSANLF